MEKERLGVLRSKIDSQEAEIERIYGLINERSRGKSAAEMEGLAFWLHNLYCAFEDIFKMVADTFENSVDSRERYHAALLKKMAIDIKGVRPALISDNTLKLLDNLRSFRHLIRHAYMYELDARKVSLVCEDALELRKLYKKEIDTFFERLGYKR